MLQCLTFDGKPDVARQTDKEARLKFAPEIIF